MGRNAKAKMHNAEVKHPAASRGASLRNPAKPRGPFIPVATCPQCYAQRRRGHRAFWRRRVNTTPRYLSAQIVSRWLASGEFPSRLLNKIGKDRAFATELVYGVVRWKRLLEWCLRQLVKQKPSPTLLNALLLTGLYQILMMENVEEYAVVNETVEAAKFSFSSKQGDFVNAVLRRVVSEKKQIHEKIENLPPGIKYSHPDLLIGRWTKHFGEKETERLCVWNNSRPDIIIRLNTMMTTWRDSSPCLFKDIPAHKHFLKAPRGLKIEDLPGYREGLFLVVDPFVQNSVELLAPNPGENVLDACAAPGGKTFLIAEKMRCQGRLTAMDVNEERLKVLRQNLSRLQIENFVEVKKSDILNPAIFADQKFDRILADVPCSNTGVIRRKPDVRWRFNLKSLGMLVEAQNKMLDQLSGLLKTGGTLVYSTCSLEPEENQMLIASWLEKNPSFCLIEERRFFPPESGTDGGYAVVIRRR